MSSPRVGVVRNSMLTNPRIVQDRNNEDGSDDDDGDEEHLSLQAPVGRSRPTGPSGPGPDFTFGISSHSRNGGVAEALSSWGDQIQRPGSSRPLVPDFVSLNRDAVRSGAVTPKKLSQYRAWAGVATTQSHTPKPKAAGARQNSVAPPDGTLGMKSQRPTSPLADLLAHRYGQLWVQEQLTRSKNRAPPQKAPGHVADTRTSLLRKRGPAPGPNRPGVKGTRRSIHRRQDW